MTYSGNGQFQTVYTANNVVMGTSTMDKLITWGGMCATPRVPAQPGRAGMRAPGERKEPQSYRKQMKRVVVAAAPEMCRLKVLTGISTRSRLFLG